MKKWILGILLASVLAGVATFLRNREQSAATPSQAVSKMIDAARNTDIQGYLGMTGGRLRAELEQTRTELGDDGFREHLRRFGEDIKAHVILDSYEPEGDTVSLDVEFVFVDRIERQRTTFTRRGNGWTITAMDTAELVKPPIPYGTPVFEGGDADST